MVRRSATLMLVVVAAIATAWVSFGGGETAHRSRREPSRSAPGLKFPGWKPPAPAVAGEPAAPAAAEPDPARPTPLAARARIRVRVIHADGSPAAGAVVEAVPGNGSARWFPLPFAPEAKTMTDPAGTASLPVAPGLWWVRVARGDLANIPALVSADGGEALLVLEPARSLRGLVLLADGPPARGYVISLTFSHAGHEARFGGTTDERGEFELPAIPDGWLDRLAADVRGPEKQPSRLWAREFEIGREEMLGGRITLRLTAVPLRGRVVDEARAPVAGAIILRAPPSAPDPTAFRFVAATGEDGSFDAEVQRVAGEAFVIRAEGFAPLIWRPEAPAAGRKPQSQEIRLLRGVPLRGCVTDPDGRPIEGATVRLEAPRLPGQVIDQAGTGADGRFLFEAIADEEHSLYVFPVVEPDLCLPQLRIPEVRGGPDVLRVVLPHPIRGTVSFVSQTTGEAVSVEHLTLIVRDARGAEAAKRTWSPYQSFGSVRFEVWEEGTYAIEVYTARNEPAVASGLLLARGRPIELPMSLVPRG